MKDLAILCLLLVVAVGTRFAFLGYSTLYHAETDFAQAIAYIFGCFQGGSLLEAMWRQWHTFTARSNPFYWMYPFTVPTSWVYGISEITVRLPAAIAGVLSCGLIYVLVRRRSSKRTALIALTLVALNPFLITFNRYGFPDSPQATLLLLGLLGLDTYSEKRRSWLLFLSALSFSIAYLIRQNAVVFIAPVVLLYSWYAGLRLRDIIALGATGLLVIIGLFIDQLGLFIPSALAILEHPRTIVTGRNEVYFLNMLWGIRGYLLYWEHTLVPAVIGLWFLRKEKDPLFKIMLLGGLIYLGLVVIQGRFFFRYMQIGILLLSAALAYPMSRWCVGRWYMVGRGAVALYVLWGLTAHADYALAQYHHIPYNYMREKVFAVAQSGRIITERSQSEADYYLSPQHFATRFNSSLDPCEVAWTEPATEPSPGDKYVNLPFVIDVSRVEELLDLNLVQQGDILVITGEQMAGGEPSPQSLGLRRPFAPHMADWRIPLIGIRKYGHSLRRVEAFYQEYLKNEDLRDAYEIVEKVFLTNGSKELAAIILRRV